MAWTTPKTWATDDLVTAALLNEQLRDNLNVLITLVPAGTVASFAGSSEPSGWLFCAGQAVSRTTYATLFAIIGTTYGTGDGSTTFNIPDLRGRFPLGKDDMGGTSANRVTATQADNLGQGTGAENHTLTTAQMPAHTHGVGRSRHVPPPYTGLSWSGLQVNVAADAGNAGDTGVNYLTDSVGSGGAHNNMPPYITLNYIIKT